MNTKSFLIATFLLFATCISLHAQEVYEYGVVTFSATVTANYEITISLNDTYSETQGKVTEGNSSRNFSPANAALQKLATEGWEVYNSHVYLLGGHAHYFYLRRKKA